MAVPTGDKVAQQFPRDGGLVPCLETTIFERETNVRYGVLEIDGSENGVGQVIKEAIVALWISGASFQVLESYTKTSAERIWLGCQFLEEPRFTEIQGFDRQEFRYRFKIMTGVPV